MRSIIRAASLALALAVVSAGTASAQAATPAPKLGFINSQVILQQMPGRAEAAAQFEKEVGKFQVEMKRMADSLRNMETAYEKQRATLSPTAREGRERTIIQRRQEFEERAQTLDQQAQQKRAELMGPLMQRVNQVIETLRTEEGYAMIFDVGSEGSGIVAADTKLDVTEKVLARLRASAGTTSSAPAKPATGAPLQAAPAGVTRPKP